MDKVNIYTGEDLKQFIREAIKEAFEKYRLEMIDNRIISRTPIKVPDVCRITGYAESTIRIKVMNREIPFHKKGARVFFFEEEILEWIKKGRKLTNEEIENDKA